MTIDSFQWWGNDSLFHINLIRLWISQCNVVGNRVVPLIGPCTMTIVLIFCAPEALKPQTVPHTSSKVQYFILWDPMIVTHSRKVCSQVLGSDILQSCMWFLMYWRDILPPFNKGTLTAVRIPNHTCSKFMVIRLHISSPILSIRAWWSLVFVMLE
jgi:hypothetical protein